MILIETQTWARHSTSCLSGWLMKKCVNKLTKKKKKNKTNK